MKNHVDQIARRVTFVWIFATAGTCLIIPLLGLVTLELVVAGAWLVWRSEKILRSPRGALTFRLAFRHVNLVGLSDNFTAFSKRHYRLIEPA